jgi:hypothetical protein
MGEPVLVALLFADRVIMEERTHKKSIIGTFSRFYTDKFPTIFAPWFIYAAVTNIRGENSFSLNLVFNKAQQVIWPISGKFQLDNVLNVVELFYPVLGARFPEEGIYTLTFNIEGIPIGSRILEVLKHPGKPPQKPPV